MVSNESDSLNSIMGIWGATGDDVFALGAGGAILHNKIPPFFSDGFETGDLTGWSHAIQ